MLTKGGFYRGGPVLSSAVAGLDQALWDIAGQGVRRARARAARRPGPRPRAGLRLGRRRRARRAGASRSAAQVEAGFTAVKMNACRPAGPIATARRDRRRRRRGSPPPARCSARTATSPSTSTAGSALADARRILPLLEPLQPALRRGAAAARPGPPAARRRSRSSPVPIATGERLYSRGDFRPVLDRRRRGRPARPVATPAASPRCAGSRRWPRRTARMLAPHCPLGPISLAASLQVAFATPNFLIQEQSLGIHYNKRRRPARLPGRPDALPVRRRPRRRGSTCPGLGIEVDEEAVRGPPSAGHAWRNPVWRHHDGSFAEW